MEKADDPFIRYLRSIVGQAVHYYPGQIDLDGAIAGAALADLCRSMAVDCVWHRDLSDIVSGIVVLGPGFVVPLREDGAGLTRFERLVRQNKVVLAPRGILQFEDVPDIIGHDVTVFCREENSYRRVRLSGLASERVHLCHDLAVHLDPTALASPSMCGEGNLGIVSAGWGEEVDHDIIDLRFYQRRETWTSLDACRRVVSGCAEFIQSYAGIVTDQPGIAILAASLGKRVVLSRGDNDMNAAVFESSIGPLFPTASLADADGDIIPVGRLGPPVPISENTRTEDTVEHLRLLLRDARRDLETLRHDNDLVYASRLSQRLSQTSRQSEAVMLTEAGSAGTVALQRRRLVPVSEYERAQRAFETSLAEKDEAHLAEILHLTEAANAQLARVAADRVSADLEVAERDADERQMLTARLASLDNALTLKSRQVLALQTCIDDQTVQRQIAETRDRHMRMLIDRHLAASQIANREADEARRLAQGIIASSSWRISGPFRVIGRAFRKVGTLARGSR